MARLKSIDWCCKVFDRNGRSRVGHNTWLHKRDGGWALQYHSTNVIEYREHDDGMRTLTVCNGGWHSVTTLQRIRHGLHELGLQLLVELGGKWRVADRNGNAWSLRGRGIVLLYQNGDGIWRRVAA